MFYPLLQIDSKWSKCFYTYMLALCHGSQGNLDEANVMLKTVPGLVKKKTNQVEAFASRRSQVRFILIIIRWGNVGLSLPSVSFNKEIDKSQHDQHIALDGCSFF